MCRLLSRACISSYIYFPPVKTNCARPGGFMGTLVLILRNPNCLLIYSTRGLNPTEIPSILKSAFWIIATKKLHKSYCIFIRQIYSCIGGELGVSVEWNELLSVPRSTARRASGAATLYWGGKSETHPGICSAASCWVLTRWAVENQTPSIGISSSFTLGKALMYTKR